MIKTIEGLRKENELLKSLLKENEAMLKQNERKKTDEKVKKL